MTVVSTTTTLGGKATEKAATGSTGIGTQTDDPTIRIRTRTRKTTTRTRTVG